MPFTLKIPTDVAVDAVQIIMDIMEQADRDSPPAGQINLGPKAVAELRDIAQRIKAANPHEHDSDLSSTGTHAPSQSEV